MSAAEEVPYLACVRLLTRTWAGSEMFLGPAHKDFHFQPKHKSNSYEIAAEG